MIKAFLSHSSNDKDQYVRIVANYLGKINIEYDEYTFEEGEKPIDEIFRGLEESQLFVLFISEYALESKWVQNEILIAEKRLSSEQLNKIYPIIIDKNITYKDPRIPDWMRQNYNIKLISKPSLVARRIERKLIKISWEYNPEIKKRENIFVGRNSLLDEFEERIISFSKTKPKVIISSGLESIGRRTFIKKALEKTDLIDSSYNFLTISLDQNDSIEDFILKLNDFGLIDINNEIKSMMTKKMKEKVGIASRILKALQEADEKLLIIDNGCIVQFNREISNWFKNIIKKSYLKQTPIINCASRYKVNNYSSDYNEFIYCINIPELTPYENSRLFNRLLEIYNCKELLNQDDFDIITSNFHGFPDQILFCVEFLRRNGVRETLKNIHNIAEFDNEKASLLLKKYSLDDDIMHFIRLIAQLGIVSITFIFEIVDRNKFEPILSDLIADNICDYLGLDGDFIKLNSSIKSYIMRNKVELKKQYKDLIIKHVKTFLEDDENFERDSSDYIYSLKEALRNNLEVSNDLLIPSHFLRSIKELYYDKKYKLVINLSDKALLSKDNIDDIIIKDIRYYLCLALARTKNNRMLKEVQYIEGPQKSFLLGFYYRLMRRYDDAFSHLDKIKDTPLVKSRARREIVEVLIQTEQHDEAVALAKDNYIENKGNQYHIHTYFNCLINGKDNKKHKTTLERLLTELKEINTTISGDMYMRSKASFEAFILHSETKALNTINDAIALYPTNHYPVVTKFEIGLKFKNISVMKDSLEMLENLVKKNKINKNVLIKPKAYFHAYNKDIDSAKQVLHCELQNYPKTSINIINNKIDKIYNGISYNRVN